MAARKAEVIYVGDAASLVRAAAEAAGAAEKSAAATKVAADETTAANERAALSSSKFARVAVGAHERVGKSILGAAKHALTGAGMFIAAYASIAGAHKAIDTTTELAHATLDLHRNLGLSIAAASRWAAVARARNIDAKAMNMSFGTLSKQIVAANTEYDAHKQKLDALGSSQADQIKRQALIAQGAGVSAKALAALGVTQSDLKNLGFEQVLAKAADGLKAMKPGAERTALAMKLFGRGWQTIVPVLRGGSKAMNEQLALADKYGVTLHGHTVKSLEELIKAQRESKFATMGLQVAFGQYLAPALTSVIKSVSLFIQGIRTGKGAGGEFRNAVVTAFNAAKTGVTAAIGAIKDAVAAVTDFIKGHQGQIRSIGKGIAAVWTGVVVPSFNVFRSVVVTAFGVVKGVVQGFVGIVKGVAKTIDGIIHGDFGKIFGGLGGIVGGGIKAAVSLFKGLASTAKTVTTAVVGAFQWMTDQLNNLFDGASGHVQGIIDKVNNLQATANAAVKAAKAIHGPRDVGPTDLFPTEGTIASTQAARDALQGTFDSQDTAAQRRHLHNAVHRASSERGRAFTAAQVFHTEQHIADLEKKKRDLPGKGKAAAAERASLTKQIGDLHATLATEKKGLKKGGDIARATADLKAFQKEESRAKQLAAIDLTIKGLEKTKAFNDALTNIATTLKDKVQGAVSSFQTQWEKTTGRTLDATNNKALDAFDQATADAVANGPAAVALKTLQDEADKAAADAQDASDSQALADAKASGDPRAIAAAQAQIVETARQRAITTAQDAADKERIGIEKDRADKRAALEQQQSDDRQAALDKDTKAFTDNLDAQLATEVAHLKARTENYATFAANVNAILSAGGVADSFAGSPDEEAAVNAGPASAPAPSAPAKAKAASKPKKKAPPKKKHHATGGILDYGVIYDVGELGHESIVRLPSGDPGVMQASQSKHEQGGGGGLHFHGPVTIGSQRAALALADRWALRARRG